MLAIEFILCLFLTHHPAKVDIAKLVMGIHLVLAYPVALFPGTTFPSFFQYEAYYKYFDAIRAKVFGFFGAAGVTCHQNSSPIEAACRGCRHDSPN